MHIWVMLIQEAIDIWGDLVETIQNRGKAYSMILKYYVQFVPKKQPINIVRIEFLIFLSHLSIQKIEFILLTFLTHPEIGAVLYF